MFTLCVCVFSFSDETKPKLDRDRLSPEYSSMTQTRIVGDLSIENFSFLILYPVSLCNQPNTQLQQDHA